MNDVSNPNREFIARAPDHAFIESFTETKRKWKMLGEHPKTNLAAIGTLLTIAGTMSASYAAGKPLDWTMVGQFVSTAVAALGLFAASDAKP